MSKPSKWCGSTSSCFFVEPSRFELELIEAEWPVIEAELAVVEAECRHAVSPSGFSLRLVRRAEQRLAVVVGQHSNGSVRCVQADAA